VLDVDDQEDGAVGVLPEDLVDLDVVGPEGVASGVPADELLALTDLNGRRGTFLIMSNMDSWKRWSRNQMLDWLGSSSNGMA
jgi:hypothetical protein